MMMIHPVPSVGCSFHWRTISVVKEVVLPSQRYFRRSMSLAHVAILDTRVRWCSTSTAALRFPSNLSAVPFANDDVLPKRTVEDSFRLRKLLLTGCPVPMSADDGVASSRVNPPSVHAVAKRSDDVNDALATANRRILQLEDSKGIVATDELFHTLFLWNVQAGDYANAAMLLERMGAQGRHPTPVSLIPAITQVVGHTIQFLPDLPNSGFTALISSAQKNTPLEQKDHLDVGENETSSVSFVGVRAEFALHKIFLPVWRGILKLCIRPQSPSSIVCSDADNSVGDRSIPPPSMSRAFGQIRPESGSTAWAQMVELLFMCTRTAVESMRMDLLEGCTDWFCTITNEAANVCGQTSLYGFGDISSVVSLLSQIGGALSYGWCIVLSRRRMAHLMSKPQQSMVPAEENDFLQQMDASVKKIEAMRSSVMGDARVYLCLARHLTGRADADTSFGAQITTDSVLADQCITNEERSVLSKLVGLLTIGGEGDVEDGGAAVVAAVTRILLSPCKPLVEQFLAPSSPSRSENDEGRAASTVTATSIVGCVVEVVCLLVLENDTDRALLVIGGELLKLIVDWLLSVLASNSDVVGLATCGHLAVWVSRTLRSLMRCESVGDVAGILQSCENALRLMHKIVLSKLVPPPLSAPAASNQGNSDDHPQPHSTGSSVFQPLVGDVYGAVLEATLDFLACAEQASVHSRPTATSDSGVWDDDRLAAIHIGAADIVHALDAASMLSSETVWPATMRRLATHARNNGHTELAVLLRDRRTALFF